MPKQRMFVGFRLDGQYALHLEAVECVLPTAEVTPLPSGPDVVLGVIKVQGAVLPVMNMRRRFGLPERAMEPGDRMIIAVTPRRRVALLVDSVSGVIERAQDEVVAPETIVPRTKYIDGVTSLDDDILLIHDLDNFLSLDEDQVLDRALSTSVGM